MRRYLLCYLRVITDFEHQSIIELLLKKKSKKLRVNDVTNSNKNYIKGESQRGVINKSTRKNKND